MASPHTCPHCESGFVQPLGWRVAGGGEVLLEIRCAECRTWSQGAYSRADVEELDRRQAAARQELVRAYERLVAESMRELAERFSQAFERDLLGPDDFVRPARG